MFAPLDFLSARDVEHLYSMQLIQDSPGQKLGLNWWRSSRQITRASPICPDLDFGTHRVRPRGANSLRLPTPPDPRSDRHQHGLKGQRIDPIGLHHKPDERIGQRAPQRQFFTCCSHEMSLHALAAASRARQSRIVGEETLPDPAR